MFLLFPPSGVSANKYLLICTPGRGQQSQTGAIPAQLSPWRCLETRRPQAHIPAALCSRLTLLHCLPTSQRRHWLSPAKVTFTLLPSPFQAELFALHFPGHQSPFWGLLGGPTGHPLPLSTADLPKPCSQGLSVSPAPGVGMRHLCSVKLLKMQAPSIPAPAPPQRRCLPVFPLAPLGHIFISNLPKPPSFPRVEEKPLLEVRMNL